MTRPVDTAPRPPDTPEPTPVAAMAAPVGGPLLVVAQPKLAARRWLGWLAVLLLAAGAGVAGWWEFARPPVVATALPWRGAALEAVYATGVVEAVDQARVGTTVAARIEALLVEEGATVKTGQVIAQLDDRQAQQRLADVRARLALAEQELARDQELAARAIRSVQQVQRSTEARDSAAAALRIAERQLAEYRIESPLDGVVMRKRVDAGETVAANAVLYEIAATEPLRIAAEVDERDIAQVREGAEVAIRAAAFPGKAITATVSHIRGRGETATRSFRVEAVLPAQSGLLIGMTVDVNIVVARRDGALLVPPATVRQVAPQGGRPGAAHVFVVEGTTVRRVAVVLGALGPAAIEVREGLAEGMRLVADPTAELADGDAVVVAP